MSAVDQTVLRINEILKDLDENELLYILTFIQKLFGGH
jgi:hypothetical protein